MRIRTWSFIDTGTGEETGTIDFGGQDRGQLCAAGEGTYYLANAKGILVYKEDGSIVEQIYDAGRGLMGEDGKRPGYESFPGRKQQGPSMLCIQIMRHRS